MPNIDWDVFKETDDEDIVTDGQYAIDKDDPGYEPAVKPEEVKGKDNTLLIDLMSGSQDISVGDIVGFKAFVRDSKGTRYIGAFLDEEDFVFNEEDTDSGITYVLDLIDHLKNKFACSNVIVDCDVYLRDADNKVVADKFTELYVEEPTEQIEESVKKLKENVSAEAKQKYESTYKYARDLIRQGKSFNLVDSFGEHKYFAPGEFCYTEQYLVRQFKFFQAMLDEVPSVAVVNG